MEMETIKITDLKPAEYNPRRIKLIMDKILNK